MNGLWTGWKTLGLDMDTACRKRATMLSKITDVNIRLETKHDYKITVDYEPTWLGRLFMVSPRQRVFVGNCTVWHELPSFRRANIGWEGYLSETCAKHKYERESK
jgi:hypothetical protein